MARVRTEHGERVRVASRQEAAANIHIGVEWLASINRLIDVQSFTWAADDIFIGSAVTFLFLIITIWFTRRPPKIAGGGPSVDAGGAH